eukprot:gb/GECG01005744.1/.p1 GENE.gb/GECG01005744.1/~~gb/GECG01005744.1/.p1  ORF type:complete len:504 (+),score=95.83 gb/GECG01005744.1/:1-1512(+)
MATYSAQKESSSYPQYQEGDQEEEEQDPHALLAGILARAGVSADSYGENKEGGGGGDDQQRLDDEATRDLLNRLAGELLNAVQEEEEEGGQDQQLYHAQETGSHRSSSTYGSYDEIRKPRPYDLWKQAHEVDDQPRRTPSLDRQQWNELVERLNETSRKKQAYLLRAQHKQIADELAGLTFTPKISKRSRLLAAQNKQLPERVSSLMKKKQLKLDKVRHERAQRELAEATFQPQLNDAGTGSKTTLAQRMNRRVGHLIQYDIDKRIRAAQRRQLQQELEDRELTFSPKLNKHSERIVERINRDRQVKAREAAEALAAGDEELAAKAAAASMGKTTKRSVEREQAAVASAALAAVEQDVRSGRLRRVPLGKNGLTMLPGHENDTFRPRINKRSHALAERAGIDQKEVYDRLYEDAKEAMEKKAAYDEHIRQHYYTTMDNEGGLHWVPHHTGDYSERSEESSSLGMPDAGSSNEPNFVPFKPKHEFLVKRAILEASSNNYRAVSP